MSDKLFLEQSIGVGESLVSGDGDYALVLQSDGNLVLYKVGSLPALWATGTDGKGGKLAVLQRDGNFVLYGPKGRVPGGALWASGTDGKGGTSIILQTDGNLVIYKSDGSAVWATGTNEPADSPTPPSSSKEYCCTVVDERGLSKFSRTLSASSKVQASGDCAKLMSESRGKGFGIKLISI